MCCVAETAHDVAITFTRKGNNILYRIDGASGCGEIATDRPS
jgi:uncharacterized metal-binding protein